MSAAAGAAGAAGVAFVLFLLAHAGARRLGDDAGRFPFALAAAAALAGALAFARGASYDAAAVALALAVAVVAAIVDRRTGLIPDLMLLPALLAVLALRAGRPEDALWGAAVTAGLLAVPYVATRGRGFGFGDVKLGLIVGAALGPFGGGLAVGASFIAGGVYAAYLLLTRRAERGTELAFGPFVAVGALASWAGVTWGVVSWIP